MSIEGKVLVVDDQPHNVKLLATHLNHAGYAVVKAYGGEEALTLARQEGPDLILLDVMMPGLDGYQVTAQLKKDAQTRMIPIVLVTALEGVEEKVRGFESGADDFLSKPVNSIELLARVRSLVKLKKLQDYQQCQVEASSEPEAVQGGDNEFILVVEDDPVAAKNYELILGKEDHTVVMAHTAAEAMEILSQRVPALIILDMMLPDMSGLELLDRIKASNACQFSSVIIVSALDDLETKVQGIDGGADDYILKPVNHHELQARVRANLRKHSLQHKMQHDLQTAFLRATTDGLTELYNRQYFDDAMRKVMAEAHRYERKFSLLLLDIDHFKIVNDTFGHVAGDHVLQELARVMKNQVRESDIACRYGGEEFTVVLPGTAIVGAVALAEKLRTTIEHHPFPDVDGRQITVSIGVTEGKGAERDASMIIAQADEALYQAKRQGRNQVRES
ncbi:MAG: diguanylate cyclase [Proteobacteria bacterium]|nr:diguanylate cyclase [Pseudomonadota bacterium]MBU1648917.1 diguanylate cyclase [Pseudomonadota bacterium]